MFTLAHLSDPHLPMPQARAVELLGKRATGYLNWWRQPGAPACARGAGRHRGRHQGRTARPHRADRRSGEHLAAYRVQPRRRMAGRAGRAARRHRHSRQPRRLCRHGMAREPRPVGRLHGGRRPAAGDRLRRLPDLAPARAGGAGRPVERRAQAAVVRHRHPGRGADRRGRADVGRSRARGALPRRADPSSAAHHREALQAPDRCRRLPGHDPTRRLRARPARPQSPQRSGAHRRAGRAGARDRRHLGLGGARQQVRPRALSSDSHRTRERGLAARRRIARAAQRRRGLRARWRPRVPQRPDRSPW